MIKSFKCKETAKIFEGQRSRKFPSDILRRIQMRLDRIDAAVDLNDLQVPPSHCLEALKGDRVKQHSIRINNQWRVCFVWTNEGVLDVEVVDYH
ncbi:MAG: plasmid maintenance system killer [Proteobacteria bacterium]|nr:MAG: plasmid maintenance system killer [Pseudomonadota bacterium]